MRQNFITGRRIVAILMVFMMCLSMASFSVAAENVYTVTFKDDYGNVLDTQTVAEGGSVTVPTAPTRDGYEFDGWIKDDDWSVYYTENVIDGIVSDCTFTAGYSVSSENDYVIVIFLDWDGAELDTQNVNYGNGAIAPADPTREGYNFIGWDKDFSNFTDTSVSRCFVTAQYEAIENGDSDVIASGTCGDNLTWVLDSDGVLTISGTGDMAYWGSYFENNDFFADTPWYSYRNDIRSVVIEEGVTDVGANAFYNCINLESVSLPNTLYYIRTYAFYFCKIQNITIPSSVIEIEKSVFQFCNELNNITVENGNADYKDIDGVLYSADGEAVIAYPAAKSGNNYTIAEGVREVAEDAFLGNQLETITLPDSLTSIGGKAFMNMRMGSKIYTSNPSLLVDINNDWNGNYNSAFTTIVCTPYTLTLYDIDGVTVVYTITDVAYDEEVSLPAGYNWAVNNELVTTYTKGENADNAVSLTAVNVYSVTFVDWDGAVLSTQTVAEGGAGIAPAEPHRNGYAFTGWDTAFDNITADTTVTAQYEINTYTVTFKDYNGTTLKTETVAYGGAATAPNNPTRASDGINTYTFAGWSPEVADTVTGDATYTATYTATPIPAPAPVPVVYTIRFLNYNRSTISSTTYPQGATPVAPAQGEILVPESTNPENYEWVFTGWDSEITAVNGNKTYVATFEMQYKQYNITFADYDGSVISSAQYSYGDAVEAPEAPTRASDGNNTYTFAGWDSEVTTVDGDKTYTATYTATPIPTAPVPPVVNPTPQPPIIRPSYSVKFVDWNGDIISEGEYYYGDKIALPVNPTRTADDVFEYAFNGWDREVEELVVGEATYTATYSRTDRLYTITFRNFDGSEVAVYSLKYGDEIVAPEAPVKPADETNTYEFAGWDKEITNVDGDKTYVATYAATPIPEPDDERREDGDEVEEPVAEPTPTATPDIPETPAITEPTATPDIPETPAITEPFVEPTPPTVDEPIGVEPTPTPEAPRGEENESNVLMYVSLGAIAVIALGCSFSAARYIKNNKEERF